MKDTSRLGLLAADFDGQGQGRAIVLCLPSVSGGKERQATYARPGSCPFAPLVVKCVPVGSGPERAVIDGPISRARAGSGPAGHAVSLQARQPEDGFSYQTARGLPRASHQASPPTCFGGRGPLDVPFGQGFGAALPPTKSGNPFSQSPLVRQRCFPKIAFASGSPRGPLSATLPSPPWRRHWPSRPLRYPWSSSRFPE